MTRVRTVLGAFLFSGDDVDKKIGVLSGGERARVALARLLIKPGNLLLMDEPTNHLDLGSSESLAESLAAYDGTLLFVSHNRSFVRRLATRIWNVEDGKVEVYPGTLDEYMYRCRMRQELAERERRADKSRAPATRALRGPAQESARPAQASAARTTRSASAARPSCASSAARCSSRSRIAWPALEKKIESAESWSIKGSPISSPIPRCMPMPSGAAGCWSSSNSTRPRSPSSPPSGRR